MLCRVYCPKDVSEIAAAGTKDYPVGFHSVTLAGQGDIGKVLVLSQSPERLRILLFII